MTVLSVDSRPGAAELPPVLSTWLRVVAASGLVLLVAGSVAAPERLWPSLLTLGYFVFGTGVGALYFLAMHYGSSGGWATVFKRVPEAMLLLVPVGGGCIAVALLGDAIQGQLASDSLRLYPWMAADEGHGGAHAASFKDVWLQPAFFYARTIVVLSVVSLFALMLRTRSLRQDLDQDPGMTHSIALRRWSIGFLVFGSVLLSVASIDWFMSLEPAWYSTMYIVYHFAGNFVTALAVIVLLVLVLRGLGLLPGFGPHHLHDLGKLLFAMSTFWMYIWFSQFMLIWYTNIPEETMYFTARLGEGRTPFLVALPLLMWVLPFFTLLSQRAKRSAPTMGRVSVVILLGHWLDLFLMTGGQAAGGGLALADLGAGLTAIALIFLLSARQLGRLTLLPVGDPYLSESLHHHV